MAYWLMKTEPSTFGLADLAARPHQTEPWDGVRNYQARKEQLYLGALSLTLTRHQFAPVLNTTKPDSLT